MNIILHVSKLQNELPWVLQGGMGRGQLGKRQKSFNYRTGGRRLDQTFKHHPALNISLSLVLGYKEISPVKL